MQSSVERTTLSSAAEIKEAKERAERQRSDLKDRLDVAQGLAGQITDHIDRYRSKPTGSSWPLQVGREQWERSRNAIEDHLRLLQRHRAQLGYAINEAARQLGDSPDLEHPISVGASPSRGLGDLIVKPVFDLMDRGTHGLSTGIGGITLGVPTPGELKGMLGLKVGIVTLEKQSPGAGYEPPYLARLKRPFYPN